MRVRGIGGVGRVAAVVKGQGFELHAGCVQVVFRAALGMHAVEAAYHAAAHHVNHRFGALGRVADGLVGGHAFLDDHAGHAAAFLDPGHAGALSAVQFQHLLR